ncbi:MAG: peptidyl-tRNA hydrolase Pth2 [Nanoarchaeota archaeon]|nr:peptidyl-tRNA hydrolase Pth2 [Nanoarchaeota archaeon]MBU4124445.1 peptidyl-tRNA hydrolase Pth2 [Nanoarchaeota archaeon]
MKQAIILRTDLGMEKGKLVSQGCHASIASFLNANSQKRENWISSGMKKIVLKVKTEKELIDIFKAAKREKLTCEIITDAGLTQLKEPSKTAVGIGPDSDEKIDKITNKLKLL